ncbi:MAG TPA: hypothetical protein VN665_03035, partial [Candidatus Paceibacterota bacterium]|nr:hypothetical protein [Candidatus Paceibacterota bacterium]
MPEVVVDAAYTGASYIPKLVQSGTMAMLDLDGTMASGDPDPSEREVRDRIGVRELLKSKGVVAGAITARTAGLTLSSAAYQASETLHKAEWPPKWGVDPETHERTNVPLEHVPFFTGCLDWDFTGSFGGPIVIKNGRGYKVDQQYYNLLRFDTNDEELAQRREAWRHLMQEFLFDYLGEFKDYMSKLERLSNYAGGITDSAPLAFRYQFDFFGLAGLEAMKKMAEIIERLRSEGNPLAIRINIVDESKPHPTDPGKSKYTLYLIPWNATKEKMVHRVFSQSVMAAGYEVKNTRLFYAGDTFTDLRAGLYAG